MSPLTLESMCWKK